MGATGVTAMALRGLLAAGAAPEADPAPEGDVRDVVVAGREPAETTEPDRSGSVVQRREMDERMPRSAPDALRYEPGVYVQQTAHAQASPYVRGLTGQQVGMFYDGVRLNNSTFRQGPNQYFFTIDSRTIDSLEVVRGSASTRYGSDAMGGALLAEPIEPDLGAPDRVVTAHGKAITRTTTADGQIGGRAQLGLGFKGKVGLFGGIGYRELGLLRSGGRLIEPATGRTQKVPPAFLEDDKTQRGTGFRELTADTRLVWQPRERFRYTLAYYDYRQYDAPRSDKCPPPTAPLDECLTYNEQFRTLVYGAFEARDGHAAAETTRVTVSYGRQHEDRTFDFGSPSNTLLFGKDNVHTIGTSARIASKHFEFGPWAGLQVFYGADAYYDRIVSDASTFFEDTRVGTSRPRGQYVDGSQYLTSGVWAEVRTDFADLVRVRAGGRGALAHAQADAVLESDSAAVARTWGTAVGMGGVAVDPLSWLTFAFNLDQGFRAPNLDDLTSRQQTGPGFQFENANLEPEKALSLEGVMRIRAPWLELDGSVYQTRIRELIGRVARTVDDCPSNEPGCGASQTVFQVANFDGTAIVWGVEGGMRLYLPLGFWSRASISWARGGRPNPFADVAAGEAQTVPMSRIPPLNGTGELGWRSTFGLYTAAAVRWARIQDRLAPQDVADPRIPAGGTPGFAVVDLRAGYRLDPYILFAVVFENVADAPWRSHGSSINGAGRGLMVEAQFGF